MDRITRDSTKHKEFLEALRNGVAIEQPMESIAEEFAHSLCRKEEHLIDILGKISSIWGSIVSDLSQAPKKGNNDE